MKINLTIVPNSFFFEIFRARNETFNIKYESFNALMHFLILLLSSNEIL